MKTICIRCQEMIGRATGRPGVSHGLCSACEVLWLEENLRAYYRHGACATRMPPHKGSRLRRPGGGAPDGRAPPGSAAAKL